MRSLCFLPLHLTPSCVGWRLWSGSVGLCFRMPGELSDFTCWSYISMSSVSADPGHPGFWVSRSKASSGCINSWTVVMIYVLNIGNPYMLSVLVLEADLIADVWKYTDLLLRWENEIKLLPSFHLQQSCESDRTNTCSSVKLPTEV